MVATANAVLLVLALVLILATALPFFKAPYWWIRMFDFPRAQIAVGMVVVLVLYGVLHVGFAETKPFEWGVLVLLGLGVLYQGMRMLPYSSLWSEETVRVGDEDATQGSFRLVISNVLMENRDIERWKAVVLAEDPDVIAAVETDAWWVDQFGRVLGEAYPHAVEQPQDDTYGMVLYSRLPFATTEVRHLIEESVPSIYARAELESGAHVQFVLLHPRPPRPDIQLDSTLRDAELVKAAEVLEDLEEPVVVMGDLNDVAWSRTTRLFQKLTGLLDPRVGRGLFATFHAEHWYLRYPLDHVFHSSDLALVEIRRLDAVGSDHFPMLIELAYVPEAASAQEEPAADAEDQEDARKMVEEAAEMKARESPSEQQEREREDQ